MNFNAKALIVSHLALLLAGFVAGYVIQKQTTIRDAETKVRYLSSNKFSLPKFNGPSITPVERIYFLDGPETERKRDTVYVSMPPSYSDDFLVTQRKPISRQGNEFQFKYFDPAMDKQVIDTYAVTPSPWKFGIHLDIDSPLYGLQPKVGPKIEIGYKAVKLNIKAQLDVREPSSSAITSGLSIRLFGNN